MSTKKQRKEKKEEEKELLSEDLSPEEEGEKEGGDLGEDSEDIEYEEEGIDLGGKLKKLKKKLEEEKKKSQDYLIGWQRERAQFMNYKNDEDARMEREKLKIERSLFTELLPVLDSFDMAFSNKEAWEKVDSSWRTGVEYIYNQLMDVLRSHGIEKIGGVGKVFNPEIHEPVEMIETNDEEKDHHVAELIQSGYGGKNLVIRPAKVKIYVLSQGEEKGNS